MAWKMPGATGYQIYTREKNFFLLMFTHPDIVFVLGKLSQFQQSTMAMH
jgi:RPA family protein